MDHWQYLKVEYSNHQVDISATDDPNLEELLEFLGTREPHLEKQGKGLFSKSEKETTRVFLNTPDRSPGAALEKAGWWSCQLIVGPLHEIKGYYVAVHFLGRAGWEPFAAAGDHGLHMRRRVAT